MVLVPFIWIIPHETSFRRMRLKNDFDMIDILQYSLPPSIYKSEAIKGSPSRLDGRPILYYDFFGVWLALTHHFTSQVLLSILLYSPLMYNFSLAAMFSPIYDVFFYVRGSLKCHRLQAILKIPYENILVQIGSLNGFFIETCQLFS